MTTAPAPRPAGSGTARARLTGLLAAFTVSALAIWLSYGFTRTPPPPPSEAKGIKVEDGHVSLESGAPQWHALQLGPAAVAGPRSLQRIPAHVALDETRTWRVGAPLGGRVTRVFVELGAPVHAGQPLFSVASPDIAAARADTLRAEVDLAAARKSLDRVRALVAARALAGKEEIAATQAERQAQVTLDLAHAKLAALHVTGGESEYTVVAPRAGVVVEKNVLPAQEVAPDAAAPLFVVGDLGSVWIVADLFEAGAAGIQQGARARVTFPSVPGLARDAQVDMVSSVYDPVRHALPVRLRLDNADGVLKPNMYAQVDLVADPPAGAAEVRASAVVTDGEAQFVFVQERQGEFSRRRVVTGSVRDGVVPVLSGLKPGEVVVERGALLLDNQMVLAN